MKQIRIKSERIKDYVRNFYEINFWKVTSYRNRRRVKTPTL